MENNKAYKSNRTEYIDIAKGIVIFLCVVGHIITFGKIPFRIIFAFHMPFFFMISGWCRAKFNIERDFVRTLKTNVLKLLLPSLGVRVLLSLDCTSLKSALINIFLNPHTEWFLPTMFASNILFFFFERHERKVKDNNSARKIAITVAIAGVTSILVKLYDYWGLNMKVGIPLSFDSVALGFVFTVIGYYLYQLIKANNISLSANSPKVLLFGTLLAVTVILIVPNYYVNICDGKMGRSDTFAYYAAVFLSLAVIWFSTKFVILAQKQKPANAVSRLLRLWGRYSLWVYLLHMFCVNDLDTVFENAGIQFSQYVRVPLFSFITMLVLTAILFSADKILHKLKSKQK